MGQGKPAKRTALPRSCFPPETPCPVIRIWPKRCRCSNRQTLMPTSNPLARLTGATGRPANFQSPSGPKQEVLQ